MRSRYTAYTRADLDYLYNSSGPAVRKDFDMASTRKWAESATWHGLEIIATHEGGDNDSRGVVEFVAHYEVAENMCDHHEIAEFGRSEGVWRFLDGRVIGPEPLRREEPKVGRNDPCPCGSGKKHKKCCSLKSQDEG